MSNDYITEASKGPRTIPKTEPRTELDALLERIRNFDHSSPNQFVGVAKDSMRMLPEVARRLADQERALREIIRLKDEIIDNLESLSTADAVARLVSIYCDRMAQTAEDALGGER